MVFYCDIKILENIIVNHSILNYLNTYSSLENMMKAKENEQEESNWSILSNMSNIEIDPFKVIANFHLESSTIRLSCQPVSFMQGNPCPFTFPSVPLPYLYPHFLHLPYPMSLSLPITPCPSPLTSPSISPSTLHS